MSVRVIIADDHPIVREGLRFSIERSGSDVEVIGEAGDGQALLDLAARLRADVYVMDVTMPVLNGIEATRALLKRDPDARVLMLSLHGSEAIVSASLQAGARGFLTKESATRSVVDAILEVNQGRCYLSPDITHYVMKGFLEPSHDDPAAVPIATRLTARERQVLQLIAEGYSNKEMAAVLGLSINTVHKHRNNLMASLDIHDQVGLVRFAIREGIAKL